jgi:hypothetical protein
MEVRLHAALNLITYGAAKAAPFQIGSRPDFQQTLQLLAVRSA